MYSHTFIRLSEYNNCVDTIMSRQRWGLKGKCSLTIGHLGFSLCNMRHYAAAAAATFSVWLFTAFWLP
jgi:hypothetical protein